MKTTTCYRCFVIAAGLLAGSSLHAQTRSVPRALSPFGYDPLKKLPAPKSPQMTIMAAGQPDFPTSPKTEISVGGAVTSRKLDSGSTETAFSSAISSSHTFARQTKDAPEHALSLGWSHERTDSGSTITNADEMSVEWSRSLNADKLALGIAGAKTRHASDLSLVIAPAAQHVFTLSDGSKSLILGASPALSVARGSKPAWSLAATAGLEKDFADKSSLIAFLEPSFDLSHGHYDGANACIEFDNTYGKYAFSFVLATNIGAKGYSDNVTLKVFVQKAKPDSSNTGALRTLRLRRI